MRKFSLVSAVLLCSLCIITRAAQAAVPFGAPASFDLTGSTIGLAVNLETPRLGVQEMALDPNPTPVTGTIAIDQLTLGTGEFSGRFVDITASTNASLARVGLNFPVTVTLNSDNVSGVFMWSQNAAIIDAAYLTATLTFGSTSWPIPLYGVPLPATYQDGVLSIQAHLEYSSTYEEYNFTAQIDINLTGTLQTQAASGAWLQLKTDRDVYANGDNLKLSYSMGNPGPDQLVDIYLGLLSPDGNLLFFPGYTTDLATAVPNFLLPSGLYIPYAPETVIHDLTLPASWPPISLAGDYQFLAAFCTAGTFCELIGDVAAAPFTYLPTYTHGYDGMWYGSATNDASGTICAKVATVQFTITDSQLSGWGEEDIAYDADGYMMTGTVNSEGQIVDGSLFEEYGPGYQPVGVFDGTLSGDSGSGTWHDSYGCYGTFTVTRSE
jgi:hypothetical protein